ncbi:MAG: ABC transporter permease [Microbacteriaceae bacterium]|uniref:ABC transporter permease n=1 Tax=unclassified Microbacterium TaxID=2609290 RepID=UPI00097EEB4F|nr:ABC transporter permease [Microbacterium sp. JB110]SJM64036.1 Alkanesulfonates transport system permease protein [Frigoribacterium sp. JB110]
MRQTRKILLGTLGVVLFLAAWQLLPMVGLVDPQYLPYATDTLARLGSDTLDLEFWRNVGRTLRGWIIGLVISAAAAVVLGTVIGLVPFLRRATHTTVEFLRPVPSVALIPIAVLVFGLQLPATLMLIVYASFWQIFVQVLYGVADVDTVARDTARSFGLTRSEQMFRVVLPTALPYLFTGLRLAASVALILSVTGEMLITATGLGGRLVLLQSSGDWAGVYAVIVVTGLLGLIINMVFRMIERRSLGWHQSVRGEEVL